MDLEKIIYNEDSGSAAIQKLDRNQRKIGNKVATINVEGLQQQINVLENMAYTSKTDYFTQGETVLDFAAKNSNSTKFVIAGITPSDLPISAEGWVAVITDTPTSTRKRVIFKPYLNGHYEYWREIFNGVWQGEWKEIPSIDILSRNKVLTTWEEVNNPNLESGIYSAEGEGVRMSFSSSVSSDYYVLIVNQHRLNLGYGMQIGIPYDYASQRGVYYRICAAGTWGAWIELGENRHADIILNGYTPSFVKPKVSRIGNLYTISGDINLSGPTPSGTVIGTLPIGFYPPFNFHAFLKAYNYDLPSAVRLWITTDGNITMHGGDTISAPCIVEFDRTVILP